MEHRGERSKPALFDRLTDDEPSESRDGPDKRFATLRQLRESVIRDLAWLLNSVRLSTLQDLAAHPYAARSVVNFGLPDLAGRTMSSIDVPQLERQLKQAIVDFEPRLLADNLTVRVAAAQGEASHNQMQFTIEAMLVAHPVPVALWLRTAIDLENGEVSIAELDREQQRS
jgi:type VI secretion system protein ImpF